MKAKVLSKIMRLEEYARLVARAVAVRVCPVCGCNLNLETRKWASSYHKALTCSGCEFVYYTEWSIMATIRYNLIDEDQMSIDFGGPPQVMEVKK